jgi:integrase
MQNGRVYEASRKFYVQYRQNGKLVSKFLCEKSPVYYAKNCKAVQLKRLEVMLQVNRSAQVAAPMADMRITDFWKDRFLPWCEELTAQGRPRFKPDTLRGYKQIWRQHLSAHFGELTLRQYTPDLGTVFLDGLTAKQSQATLRHIKSIAQSLFKRAVSERRLQMNPWKEVVMPESAIMTPKTPCYTWDEAKKVIQALEGHPDCQLIMALACFLGLRPNEIAALRWEDLDGDWLHIRRGIVRGKLDVPKSEASMNCVPLPEAIRKQLEIFGAGKSGWMFPSEGVLTADKIVAPEMKHLAGIAPVDLHNLIARVIRPVLASKGLAWKPLKAGRTGACTQIIEQTGNLKLAQRMLRHADKNVTLKMYDQGISNDAALSGARRLELPETIQ